MNLVIQTWNGKDISDTHYLARIPTDSYTNLVAQAVSAPRAGDFPYLSTVQWSNQIFPFEIALLDRGSNMLVYRNKLKGWFADGLQHKLVAFDVDDSNRPWYLSGVVVAVTENDWGVITVSLSLASPVWQLVTASTDTWSVTASGQTKNLTVLGNYPAKPVITYTPTSPRTGQYAYKRWIPVYNPLTVPQTFLPVNIVGTTLNTAALVTASKMLASGDDLAVSFDGTLIDRWLNGINTTTTKVWITDGQWSPNADVTIATSIANTGAVATINIARTATNLANLTGVLSYAANKVVMIDNEAFQFTSVSTSGTYYSLTGCTRAVKGTSMSAHSVGAAAHWIEHDIWLLYGNATAPTPVANPNDVPMIALTSTNTSWIWTNFYSTLGYPGGWAQHRLDTLGKKSLTYTANQGAMADPATEMGISIVAYTSQNVWKAETAALTWEIHHPAGFTNLLYSGKKYTLSTSWPAVVAFQTSLNGSSWTTNLAEAVPAPNTWTAFGARNQAIGASSPYLRFIMDGSIAAQANNVASIQFDTVTATISSGNVLQIALGAEINNYHVAVTLTNNNTGEWIYIYYPAEINHTITIDCLKKRCTYDDGATIPVQFSSTRADWLNLVGGATNVIQEDDTGTGNATVGFSWSDMQI